MMLNKCDRCYDKGYIKCYICEGKGDISRRLRVGRNLWTIAFVILLLILII